MSRTRRTAPRREDDEQLRAWAARFIGARLRGAGAIAAHDREPGAAAIVKRFDAALERANDADDPDRALLDLATSIYGAETVRGWIDAHRVSVLNCIAPPAWLRNVDRAAIDALIPAEEG